MRNLSTDLIHFASECRVASAAFFYPRNLASLDIALSSRGKTRANFAHRNERIPLPRRAARRSDPRRKAIGKLARPAAALAAGEAIGPAFPRKASPHFFFFVVLLCAIARDPELPRCEEPFAIHTRCTCTVARAELASVKRRWYCEDNQRSLSFFFFLPISRIPRSSIAWINCHRVRSPYLICGRSLYKLRADL